MGKILAVFCMAFITVFIFLAPDIYYQNIDTRLNDNRQEDSYSVNIKNDLSSEERKEMLVKNECLINEYGSYDSLSYTVEEKIRDNISFIGFDYEDYDLKYYLTREYMLENIYFKITGIDDEQIKSMLVGVVVFNIDNIYFYAMYDVNTSEIYIFDGICRDMDETDEELFNIFGLYNGHGNSLTTEEILKSKNVMGILEKTMMRDTYVVYMNKEMNLVDTFETKLKNSTDMAVEAEDGN